MAYTEQQNNDLISTTPPDNALEQLLDKIADALIVSPLIDTTAVENAQKTISNGKLQVGRDSTTDRLILYQKDVKANQEDLQQTTELDSGEVISILENLANQIIDFNTLDVGITEGIDNSVGISLVGGGLPDGGTDITQYIIGDGNPLNVSQFVSIKPQATIIDVNRAEEFLDTNIYELLPTGDARQARIVRLFQELNALLPPLPGTQGQPSFDENEDQRVDLDSNGNWISSSLYDQNTSISYAQDNQDSNIDEEDAFLHRLRDTSNDTNLNLTIQDIYNTVEPYLQDILEDPIELQDMPLYQNQSSGYLKFRNPNQGIIIRNTNQDFIEGLNPNNPTWLTTDYNGLLNTYNGDAAPYDNTTNFILNNAGTGFTITMWVKFLDKSSQGTLFNYGNPSKAENPFGFKLETYVVNRNDATVTLPNRYDNEGNMITTNTFGEFVDSSNNNGDNYFRDTLNLFQNTNSERFVRLQVREFGQDVTEQDYDRGFRSSELGNPGAQKFTWNAPELGGTGADDLRLLSNTNIPEDFNEWYFICASYNPSIIEPNAADYPSDAIEKNPLYWLNHINPTTGDSVTNSGAGNKCKVEIISRSDLLRARGFRV